MEKKRVAKIIKVRDEKTEEYVELHRKVWPSVLETLKKSNIRNYSIFLKDGLLFSYFEYQGSNYDLDMQKIAKDSATRNWWKLTDPCQISFESENTKDPWSKMIEVFHME